MPRGGKREGAGRPKGVPNRLNSDIKAAIFEAFEMAGGPRYLAGVAKDNPSAFCALLGRVLPKEIVGDDGGPIRHEHALSPALQEAIDRIVGAGPR